jgi:type IV pilus assembly protein PilQ
VNNPITSERVATTEVAIESGMTVVIGGLIKDTMADAENGIPLLKDIPVLGWLFKNKTKNKSRTELLIFITPELQPRSV